jgi:RNA polymerase sigma-70 factor, ECF subfamily
VTDWWQVRELYDQLMAVAPTPVVALNPAVAVAEVEGPEAGLALVDGLDPDHLDGYHVLHTVRAELLRRLGRDAEAADAYRRRWP